MNRSRECNLKMTQIFHALPFIVMFNYISLYSCARSDGPIALTNLNQCVPLAGKRIKGEALRSEVVCVFYACEGLHSPSVNTEMVWSEISSLFRSPD